MRMQHKVLANLKALIESTGLEALDRPQWANTGSLSIQRPKEIKELASVRYDFQDTWGTITFTITVGDRPVPSQPGRPDYFDFRIDYTDGDGFKVFRNRLQHILSTIIS